MTQPTSPLIQAKELLVLYNSKNLILVDASNSKNAYENYHHQHLDKAIFIDLNTDLADIKQDFADGGRHPLPTIKQFSETLSRLGISKDSHVVVYDDKNGSNASARFWWMLKAIGHEKVQVLDGGFQEAERVGFPINANQVTIHKTQPYKIEGWKLPVAAMAEVEKASQDQNHIVIDVRDSERYRGEKEPIDLIAGHIPGAINIPFTKNLDENGLFLSSDELKEKYLNIFDGISPENIIVHCGSGVTACHTLLAIASAGLEIPKLYVGSWSEWSRNKV
ncbi:thiosulfate/3-mercaptopyruvate sulfurtransferase [Flavobacterium arsenatis]|uniref:Thiosulfate/3-mercaptopyruvate sulfurtransferase n=1 Tax=Flavobacterium arsenatis TaxID=1484332 RepID=A0ABU1TQT8_9FLAO|nr:sulfurtransferase [Flavobacterium arsenatis]MDR6968261.1 thiosulfate/3-mercaptopyruvate sulfurtransferase [Flavobacterium arsenatis]